MGKKCKTVEIQLIRSFMQRASGEKKIGMRKEERER